MAKDRPEFEKSELQLASDYLEYHVNMYTSTYQLLTQPGTGQILNNAVRNALLVAHLVHMRLIFDFLSRTSSRHTKDVLAIDFFPPDQYRPLQDKVLRDWKDRVGSRTAHLTVEAAPRLISEQEWDIAEIATRLIPPLREFLDSAPDELFRREPEDHKEAMLRHVGKFELHSSGGSVG
jgi:hypothetical protein